MSRHSQVCVTAAFACLGLSSCGTSGSGGSAPVGSGGTGSSTYTLSATVSGLDSGKQLVLEDNGASAVTISNNQLVTLASNLTTGTAYAVTVSTQPNGETCTVSSGSGVVTSANVSIAVSCSDNTTTNPTSVNEFTWMGGSNVGNATAVYGTKGVPSTTNVPGAQALAGGWIDATGNFWLFNSEDTNALWMYAPSAGTWTWVGGSNTQGAPGVYGTRGVAAPTNIPGARGGSRHSRTAPAISGSLAVKGSTRTEQPAS